jgi:hypothetical protein
MVAYLMRKFESPLADVLGFVRTKRNIKPNSNFTRRLEIWEEIDYKLWEEDGTLSTPKAPYKTFLQDQNILPERQRLLEKY